MKKIKYISAGAGSGKTTQIVKELVDVLSNQDMDIKTSEIVMATFSRAAANEMRERTRKGLLEKGMVKDASELDAAMIGTIHSLCLRYLQKYWYVVGMSPEPKQLEENDFEQYLSRSLENVASEEDMKVFEKWRKLLNITKKNGRFSEPDTTYWSQMLKSMVEKVRYYKIEELDNSCNESKKAICDCWSNMQFDVVKWGDLVGKFMTANEKDTNGNGSLSKRAVDRKNKILAYDPLRDGRGGCLKTNAACVRSECEEMNHYLCRLEFTDERRDILCQIVQKLFDTLKAWKVGFDDFKKQNHLLDYNDMELGFLELLENDEVAEEISSRVKLVMVDEYQDCNTVQVNIFKKLSELVARKSPLDYSSIWVGDPKQAIYGFRGSDTELTKSVSDEIHSNVVAGVPGFMEAPLQMSFRSVKGLVELVNDTFWPIFGSSLFGLSQAEVKLNVGRVSALPVDQKFALRWGVTSAEELAERIRSMVLSGGYKVEPKSDATVRELRYEDIAVLVRNNYEASDVAEALRRINVPVCVPEQKSFSRIEVQLLLALLQYAKQPSFRRHLRLDVLHILKNEGTEALLNDYVQYLNGKVITEVVLGRKRNIYPQDWRETDDLIALLETIAKECYGKNMHDTMATFVDRLRLMDVVERWGEAETRKDNVSNMLKQAAQFDKHCEQMELEPEQRNFAKFVQYMMDSTDKPKVDMDRKAVKVVSLHSSKGLDWPVVVLFGLDGNAFDDEKIAHREFVGVREQKIVDKYWLRVFPPMGVMLDGHVASMLSSEPYFQASRVRLLKEEARLLYVGMTRARDILVLATKVETPWLDKILTIGFDNVDRIKHRFEEDLDPMPPSATPSSEAYGQIDTEKLAVVAREGKHMLNPSTMDSGGKEYGVKILDLEGASFEVKHEGHEMSTIGTCIHNIYAAYSPQRTEEDSVEMAERVIRSFGLENVMEAAHVVNAIGLLYKRLAAMFGSPTEVGHEVPFSLSLGGDQLLHGEMDLLWKTSDGVVLVDFKNVKSEEPGPEHYFGQMWAYEQALEAAGQGCRSIVLFYANLGKLVVLEKK